MSRADSWRNQYQDVEEFDLPLERDRMLPSSPSPSLPMASSLSTTPPATQSPQRNSRSFASSPLNPQGTPAFPAQPRPSSSSGSHNTHQRHPSASKPLPRSPSAQQLQHPPSSMPAPSSSSSSSALGASPPVPTSPFGRPGSRGSFNFNSAGTGSITPRSPNLTLPFAPPTPTSDLLAAHHSFGAGLHTVGSRGSMILYRRADSGLFSGGGGGSGTATPVQVPSHTGVSGMSGMSEDAPSHAGLLPPPPLFSSNKDRGSVYSTMTSGDSLYGVERGLVAYAYDPDEDDESDDEEGDWLHDPEVAYPGSSPSSSSKGKGKPLPRLGIDPTTGQKITDPTHPLYIPKPYIAPRITWRGFVNIGMLVALVASLLCLFVVYPMVRFYADDGIKSLITGNLRINSTGQAEYFPDEDTSEDSDGTPTSTSRPRSTVTSINEGGNIFDRRAWNVPVVWKRETDDWAVEFPVPSYNLNYLAGEVKVAGDVKPVEVQQVKEVEKQAGEQAGEEAGEEGKTPVQIFEICFEAPSTPLVLKASFDVGHIFDFPYQGQPKEVVEGTYEDGRWTFTRSEVVPSAQEGEGEGEEDDGWILVKKNTVQTKKMLALRVMDDPSTPTLPAMINTVRLSTSGEPLGVWTWADLKDERRLGECEGEREVVDVMMRDVSALGSASSS